MRKLNSLLIAVFIVFSASAENSEKILKNARANQIVEGSELVRMKDYTDVPNFVKFKKGHEVKLTNLDSWLLQFYDNTSSLSIELVGEESDELGFVHYRYQQTYKGTPIEYTQYIAHVKNGKIVSLNGELYSDVKAAGQVGIDEITALNKALDEIGAEKYKWELPAEEEFLKREQNDPNATFFPDGELTVCPVNGDFYNGDLRLAYKFNIYAQEPLYRADVYVDAITGDVIFENNRICHASVTATANTAYSGSQTIITETDAAGYRLDDQTRGNGIRTWDMQNGTTYSNAIDITNSTTTWNLTGLDQYGLDAHWGSEMTYDYYFINHGRNSIDGSGFALNSYVHYDNNYANAFWDGQRMTYGDGNSTYTALTTVDIAGHEITHGLTNFTANLVYQDESGALNESFSDIFGNSIEFYAKGAGGSSWKVGEEISSGSPIRDMKNPKNEGDPENYLGTNWYTGTNDNGGVHTNSGVQNFWYYLLVEGTSGTYTNDFSDTVSITGIGWTKASEIAFRNLTVYMTSSSQYSDARFYAIQSAQDLFGGCTPELKATTNAWFAVNVGPRYVNGVVSDFAAQDTTECVIPATFNFTNNSSNSKSYKWDFGDGSPVDTNLNPSHTYTSAGTYSVELIADGGSCGSDTTKKTTYISVNPPTAPVGTNDSICPNNTATVTATGSGNLKWYNSSSGGGVIGTGTSYTTPVLTSSTTYYVEDEVAPAPQYLGAVDNSIGTGRYFEYDQHLIFDAYTNFTLVSVHVYSDRPQNRTIELRDNSGTVLQDTTIYIQDNSTSGGGRITLNFDVQPGTDYQLGVSGNNAWLYRNSSGPTYPYTISGVASITGSSASTGGYYYFFYDWEVQERPCVSSRTPVEAHVKNCTPTGQEELSSGLKYNVYPNPVREKLNIDLTLVNDEPVTLEIFDVNGRIVEQINQADLAAGTHHYEVDVSDLSKGVYNCKLTTSSTTMVKRVVVSR